MIYNPVKDIDCTRAIEKLQYFIKNKQPFEMKRMAVSKSSNQNRYFHLIVGWFAWEYGETAEYVKQEMIKKIIVPEVFKKVRINEKTGEIRDDWRSFTELSKGETNYVIDKFRDYSAKNAGIYLPEPKDLAALQEMEVQLKNNEKYL